MASQPVETQGLQQKSKRPSGKYPIPFPIALLSIKVCWKNDRKNNCMR